MLQKYISYPSHILDVELVQTVDMTYKVELIQIQIENNICCVIRWFSLIKLYEGVMQESKKLKNVRIRCGGSINICFS